MIDQCAVEPQGNSMLRATALVQPVPKSSWLGYAPEAVPDNPGMGRSVPQPGSLVAIDATLRNQAFRRNLAEAAVTTIGTAGFV